MVRDSPLFFAKLWTPRSPDGRYSTVTYLFVYATLLLGGFITASRPLPRTAFYYMCLTGLFVFVGFRYEVGCDWSGYEIIFEAQRYETFADTALRSEPAFGLLNAIVHYSGLEYPYINVFSSAAFFLGFHALAKRQPDRLGFLILSFPVLLLNLPMSANRQAIAVGFLCVASNAFVECRLWRFVILVVCASGFHSSALTYLLFAPLIHGQLTPKKVALAGLIALPGAYLLMTSEAFNTYSQRYVGTEIDAAGAVFRAGLLAIAGAVFLRFLNAKWKTEFPRDHKLVLLSSYLMVIMLPAALFSSVIGDRFGYYLNPTQLIILARLPFLAGGRHSILIFLAPYAALGLVLLVWTQTSTMFSICYEPYRLWW
jgi:hypothetical protein